MKVKSKKHWYSYTGNLFSILFLGIPCLIFYYKKEVIPEIHPYLRIGVLVFGVWLFYKMLRGIILNSRVEWIFENNVLTIKSGLLPWRRTVFGIDISQIYEAYYSKSFMGTLLGFGGIYIRRTDGVTSKIYQLTMNNHKKMVSEINNAISLYKNDQNEKNEVLTSKESLSDELRKLADLNKDGVISDEEFEKLKRKLLNNVLD
ncbi:SHOCT domain-containing protein [Aquimarina algicola]|nr:SHOCT domain-containing protein [Aquimarina algicola]